MRFSVGMDLSCEEPEPDDSPANPLFGDAPLAKWQRLAQQGRLISYVHIARARFCDVWSRDGRLRSSCKNPPGEGNNHPENPPNNANGERERERESG